MAAINQFNARYKPGQEITAKASGTVRGGRFVKIAATKDTDGNYVVSECGLGEAAFGYAAYDATETTGNKTAVIRCPAVGRIVPGAAITAGDKIQSDAQGRAIPRGSEVKAALNTGVAASNNGITWTARQGGTDGNSITVTIVDPAGNNGALSVDVDGTGLKITVTAATDGASAIASTAQQIINAIEAHGEASELVDVAHTGASTGAALVTAVAETPLAGGTNGDGSGYVLGEACADAASDDRFAEIDLWTPST